MNETIKTWTPIIVVLVLIGIIVMQTRRINALERADIDRIKASKDELMNADSLRGAELHMWIDSVGEVLDRLGIREAELSRFNNQIQTQNEKLEKIYHSFNNPSQRPDPGMGTSSTGPFLRYDNRGRLVIAKDTVYFFD